MGQADTLRGLQGLINSSRHKVTVCPRQGRANMARNLLGIAGSSVLGAIIDQTGGIVVADGFIKHLGGDNATGDSLAEVNGLGDAERASVTASLGALVVAIDMFGGIFALPTQATDPSQATVRYLPYDGMVWEDFGIGHGDFVAWSMGESARNLYPSQSNCDMSRGSVVRYEPPLWMRTVADDRPKPSIVPIAAVVWERIGLSCAIYEATAPGKVTT